MKKQFLLILFSLMCSVPSLVAQQLREDSVVAAAKVFVGMLSKGEPSSTETYFDSTMNALMPAPKLHEVWGQVIEQVGTFRKEMGARLQKYGAYDVVFVTCGFERDTLDVQLSYNTSGRIAGLFFAKHSLPAVYHPPSYARRELFTEEGVVVGSGMWALPGTLTMPTGAQNVPAVVLVHGSGSNDRDETVGPNKPFRDLALGLASEGVAVLRYEKRTKEHAAQVLAMRSSMTVKEETIDDALLAVSLLRRTQGIDPNRIFVLGHSLGGTLAPRIGKLDPHIAGLIILAGAARPLEDIMVEQMKYLLLLRANPSSPEKKQIERAEEQRDKIKSLKVSDSSSTELLLGAPPSYWLDLRGYDPTELAKTLRMRMLILQGKRDYQITLKDFNRWKAALESRKDVTFKLYPKLTHLFIGGEGRSEPSEYERGGNISLEVIDDIAGWVKKAR